MLCASVVNRRTGSIRTRTDHSTRIHQTSTPSLRKRSKQRILLLNGKRTTTNCSLSTSHRTWKALKVPDNRFQSSAYATVGRCLTFRPIGHICCHLSPDIVAADLWVGLVFLQTMSLWPSISKFYRAMLRIARMCYRKMSVRLFVSPSHASIGPKQLNVFSNFFIIGWTHRSSCRMWN